MHSLLVVLEQQNGILRRSSCDLFRYATSLKRQNQNLMLQGVVIGPLAGGEPIKAFSSDERIVHIDEPQLSLYQPDGYVAVLDSFVAETGATRVLFADSAFGADCAARLAALLNCDLLTHCGDIRFIDGHVEADTAWYAGSVSATMVSEGECAVMTVIGRGGSRSERESMPQEITKKTLAGLESSSWNPVVDAFLAAPDEIQDMTEAAIIIAGGRGMGGAEGFEMLESLACVVGGRVGASRSAVDEEWRPHSDQIGQTGKTVVPRLYVACGISGAVQHLAGMSGAATVIAINSDPDAPIFSASDYGIVGDVADIVPRLEALIRERIGKK